MGIFSQFNLQFKKVYEKFRLHPAVQKLLRRFGHSLSKNTPKIHPKNMKVNIMLSAFLRFFQKK